MSEDSGKKLSLGRAAIYLAMTEDRQKEDQEKERLLAMGYSVVATEVTGTLAEFKQKIIKNKKIVL